MIEQQVEQLLQARNWTGAEAESRRLLTEHPTNARLHGLLGMSLLRQEKLEEAALEFQRAVILEPMFWEVQLKLAQTLDRLQRYEEALEAASAGLKVQPNDRHLQLLVEGLSRIAKVRQDGWERTVNIDLHNVELHGPDTYPEPPKEQSEEPQLWEARPKLGPATLR